MKFHGDNFEVEHAHALAGRPGKVRLLYYRNQNNMGRWDDAMRALQANPARNAANCTSFSYGNPNAGAPDLCWARRANTKTGFGINIEQAIADDVGMFFRGMRSDGDKIGRAHV